MDLRCIVNYCNFMQQWDFVHCIASIARFVFWEDGCTSCVRGLVVYVMIVAMNKTRRAAPGFLAPPLRSIKKISDRAMILLTDIC